MRRALLGFLLAACASGGAPNAANPVAAAHFAPPLGVDLSAMRLTGRGVYVRDLVVGQGATAARGSSVKVRYAAWLADGTPVDSTAAREGPIAFVVGRGRTIAGWDDGIPGMRVGGRRQLVIPPALGYGRNGSGPIPPDAVLVFTVDLVDAR
jgi:FKBP-type peptidyl-prolyl cis-trans isomerase